MAELHLHFKTELCDGNVHMTAHEYCEHKIKEHHEYQKRMLRKLANNPAINDDFRDVLWNAILNIDYMEHYRKLFQKEREQKEMEKNGKR